MPNPAPYTNTDTAETGAITVLRTLVDGHLVKLDVKERDKVPNTDGTAELVDEAQIPIGKLDVQVKKIPKGQRYFPCEVELFAYSEATTLPVLLICVDVEAKVAFWRRVSTSCPEYKPDQGTCRLKFDERVDAIGPASNYYSRWLELVKDYQKRITEFPFLKTKVDQEIGLANVPSADVAYFQQYVDKVNRLLDFDFPIVKQQFFADVWKLGVGICSANPDRVHYRIYAIANGANAPLVSSFIGQPLDGFLPPVAPNVVSATTSGSGSEIESTWTDRTHLKAADLQATDFVSKWVRKMVDQKLFHLAGTSSAREYLFKFVDRYAHCLGLPESDKFKIADLNYAFRVYLPGWYCLASRRYYEINAGVIPAGVFPSFENIAGMHPREERPTTEQVQSILDRPGRIPPMFVSTESFSFQTIAQALDYLIAENVAEIERPYRKPTGFRPHIWDGFTPEDMRANVTTILEESVRNYGAFVGVNSLEQLKSRYLDENVALIFVGKISEWTRGKVTPVLEHYFVDNADKKLSKVVVLDENEGRFDTAPGSGTVSVDGLSRTIISNGGELADDLFEDHPILVRTYDMLRRDLEAQYGLF